MATQIVLEIFVLVPIVTCWIFIAIFIFKPDTFSMLTFEAAKAVLGVGVCVTLILIGLRLVIWPGPENWRMLARAGRR